MATQVRSANKEVLVRYLVGKYGYKPKGARQAIDDTLEAIAQAFQGDEVEAVHLGGFGTFKKSVVKGRKGVKPPNGGAPVDVPDSRIVRFRAHARLREAL